MKIAIPLPDTGLRKDSVPALRAILLGFGEQARQERARPIRRRLSTLASGLPMIVTGDFNTPPSSVATQSPAYR
ncbi:hypothetical protein BH11GEM1_BH11GEM1_35930 [soil metagenome]